MHKRNYNLAADAEEGGKCNDADYQIMTFDAKLSEDGSKILLNLPDTDSLDAVLSTTKWMIRKAQEESHMLSASIGNATGGGIEITGPTDAVQKEASGANGSQPQNGKAVKASCGDGAKLEW
jgi:nitrite reductase (NAD(P)H)